MLNIEEIKADYEEFLRTGSVDEGFDLAHTIPALIAEMERLEKIVKMQKVSCSLVQTVEAGNIIDENSTLKKALKLASRSLAEETSTTGEEESISDNADYNYGYFLMQAQEANHET